MLGGHSGPREARTIERLNEPECWDVSGSQYVCLACDDSIARDLHHAIQHQTASSHAGCVEEYRRIRAQQAQRGPPSANVAAAMPRSLSTTGSRAAPRGFSLDALTRDLMRPTAARTPNEHVQDPRVNIEAINFGDGGSFLQQSVEETEVQPFIAAFHAALAGDIDLQDSDNEPSDDGDRTQSEESDVDDNNDTDAETASHASVPSQPSSPFFPWKSSQDFSLDATMHLGRSVFSERQLDILRWSMQFNGVQGLPSVSAMKRANKRMQDMYGIETVEYMGRMGHRYYVNSLRDIIAQEPSNPRVAPYLQYLPIESSRVSDAFNAQRWLVEIDAKVATPMIRRGTRDFYAFEPARLKSGQVFMPTRWFIRKVTDDAGHSFDSRCATGWAMNTVTRTEHATHESVTGWCVDEFDPIDVLESELDLPMDAFERVHVSLGLPSPTAIRSSAA